MDVLQFVYPWSHSFFAGIVLLILVIALLFGLYLLYLSYKLKNSNWRMFLMILSFLLITLPVKNFICYTSKENLTFVKYAGKYISSDNKSELNLLTDNTWESRGLPLEFNKGTWDLIISDDGIRIDLFYTNCEENFVQLWPNSDLRIFVMGKNSSDIKIELYKYD